jgi:hypothetical protein
MFIVAAAAVALLAPAPFVVAQAPAQFAAKLSPSELKIETALASPVKVSYRDTPLKDVIADLAKQAELPIELDPEGLEEADIVPEQAVSLELGTFPLRQTLDVLLGPLHLHYRVTADALVITSEEECAEQPTVRIYPVLDLVRAQPRADSETVLDFDTLIDTITSHLSPDTWTDNGGPSSIVAGPGGCLVVSQTYSAHRDIENLLTGLRQLKSDQEKLKPGEIAPVIDFGSNHKIRQALAKRDTSTLDIELKFYVQDVAKVVQCPIILDPEGLEEADASADEMIHVSYHDARIGDVFRRTLGKLHLEYVVCDGYIVVTSHEKEAEAQNTRLYPVGDLVPLRNIQDPPIRDFDTLIGFVTSGTREPYVWTKNGGQCQASAWQEPPALIVSAHDEVHDDIEQLLNKLRASEIAEYNAEMAKADQRIVERIYPLYMTRREKQAKAAKAEQSREDIPSAADVAKLIAELLPEVSFKEEGTLLRPFHDRLIVRHRPTMLHKIEKLLQKIDAWPPVPGQGAIGRGGFFDIGEPAASATGDEEE